MPCMLTAAQATLPCLPCSSVRSNADDGSQLLASVDQALPLLQGWLSFTRLRLRADKPIQLGPLSLHLKVR